MNIVGTWCVKAQITDLQSPNNIWPWARTGPICNPQLKASTKGIYLGPWITKVHHYEHHYESDDKSPMVKYLYLVKSINLSFKPQRNDLGTNGIIWGRFLKFLDKSTIIRLTNLHLMLDN